MRFEQDSKFLNKSPARRQMLYRIRIKSNSEQDTVGIGRIIGEELTPGDMITLIGNLGCGKTRLAKGIVSRAIGIPDIDVVSPSFTLVNRYDGTLTIDHADLYRVGPEAVDELGLSEILELGGVLITEWASDENELSETELRVIFYSDLENNSRELEFNYRVSGTWEKKFPISLKKRSLQHR